MEKFGFLLHPFTAMDVARKYPLMGKMPEKLLEKAMRYVPPFEVSHVTGVASPRNCAEGWLVACPLTSAQMLSLPESLVLSKIIRAGRLAEKLGAKILGLGAFTSVVGDAGITVAQNLSIPVTTGNSYTVATAIEGTKEAARRMGMNFQSAQIVILGATGSIGAACAQILAQEVKYLTLTARNERRLEKVAAQIYESSGLSVRVTGQVKAALQSADVVIAVTSALDSVIEAEDLKPGAVVCDVARPRSVSRQVAERRQDVLVIEGGIVEVPGDVDFHFSFGFPERTAYACMAETMILAMERRYESFTLGRHLTVRQVCLMDELAKKHGFKLAGLRSFERAITDEEIEGIKKAAQALKSEVGHVG